MIDLKLFQNFAPAAERNGSAILQQLQQVLGARVEILEVGSGSGQHAAFFTCSLSHLRWQSTEVAALLPVLEQNLKLCKNKKLYAPVVLDLSSDNWFETFGSGQRVDAVFTANTLHIVSWDLVESLFKGCGALLTPGALLIVYGPVRYSGCYTSDSNRVFDNWLKERDPLSGIRDYSELALLAQAEDFVLISDISMPANNQLLVWQKQ